MAFEERLEESIAEYNSNVFLREFTYDKTNFKNSDGEELEFCDSAVWIDDLLIIQQLKQRNEEHASHSAATERKWFTNKIEKKAVGQIADSLRYLSEENSLPVVNRRGQLLDLAEYSVSETYAVVLYSTPDPLPLDVLSRKGRFSKRARCFVHFFDQINYVAVCSILHTPREIADYLKFRETFIAKIGNIANCVSEKAMLGKFLTDTDDCLNVVDAHELFVDRLVDDRSDFSIMKMLDNFYERTDEEPIDLEYYKILAELAKLPRNLMKQFRIRAEWSMEKCNEPDYVAPSRFYYPHSDCSFIAIPLPDNARDDWQRNIEKLTHLSKYEHASRKAIGFTTATNPRLPQTYIVHWIFLEYEWVGNEQADSLLKDSSPFRTSDTKRLGKYYFE